LPYDKDGRSVVLRGWFNKGFDIEIKGGEEGKEDSGKGFFEWGEFPLEVVISNSELEIVSGRTGYREVD